MTSALLLAVCAACYLAATGAMDLFNTIPVRAASTGLLLVTTPLTIISAAVEIAALF